MFKDYYQKYRFIFFGLVALLVVFLLITIVILIYRDSRISAKDFVVTNTTDTAFTITWKSESKYIGRIYYQQSDKNWLPLFAQMGKKIAYDDRDVELNSEGDYVQVEGGAKERYTHHVTIGGLKPDTEYSFRVGGTINGREGEVKTAKTNELNKDLKVPDPAYGEISGVDNNDSIVIFTESKTKYTLSTWINANSTYSFDYNQFSEKNAKSLEVIIRSEKKSYENIKFTDKNYKPLQKLTVRDLSESSERLNFLKQTSAAELKNTGEVCYGTDTTEASKSKFLCSAAPGCYYQGIGENQESQVWSRSLCVNGGWCCRSVHKELSINLEVNHNSSTPTTPVDSGQPVVSPTNSEVSLTTQTQDQGGSIIANNTPPQPVNQPRSNIDIPIVTGGNMRQVFQQNWGIIKDSLDLRSKVGGDIPITFGGSSGSVCVAGPTLDCGISDYVIGKGAEWARCLLYHEAHHYLQRSCRSTLPDAPSKREFSAEIESVKFCGGNGTAYGQGDYNCKLTINDSSYFGQRIADGSVAYIEPIVNNYLRDKLGSSAVTLQDVYNCKVQLNTNVVQVTNNIDLNCRLSPSSNNGSAAVIKRGINNEVSLANTLNSSGKINGVISSIKAQNSKEIGLTINQSGLYSFSKNNNLIASQQIILQDNENSLKVRLFNDANNNGVKDASEGFVDTTDIELKKESELIRYELQPGWNLINIPLAMESTAIKNASTLIQEWNHTYAAQITQVASFHANRFEIYTGRGMGIDFDLQVGKGMFVYNAGAKVQVGVLGRRPLSSVPLVLDNGWNLVGIVAPGRSYTSETLIEKMEAAGVKADTVSQFENGLYKSQVKEEGTVFGNSFKILDKRGYFVRVDEGGGQKFTP